jgi:hypothetical protein
MYLFALLIFLPLASAVAELVPARYQPFAVAVTICIGLTPSLAPATIAVIVVPFGLNLLVAIFAAEMQELGELIAIFAIWHLLAFPTTFAITYALTRLFLRKEIHARKL